MQHESKIESENITLTGYLIKFIVLCPVLEFIHKPCLCINDLIQQVISTMKVKEYLPTWAWVSDSNSDQQIAFTKNYFRCLGILTFPLMASRVFL